MLTSSPCSWTCRPRSSAPGSTTPRRFPFTPVPIAANVPERVIAYVEERRRTSPASGTSSSRSASTRSGSAAAHILGYLGEISEEKLEDPAFADYQPGDRVGRGRDRGRLRARPDRDAGAGEVPRELARRDLEEIGPADPVPGDDVYLTIDADTQRLAEDALKGGIRNARGILDETGYLKADAGAVVVMNPDTGGIEAMVSYPGFEPSLFVRGMSNARVRAPLRRAEGEPAAEPRDPGRVPAGVDLQAVHRALRPQHAVRGGGAEEHDRAARPFVRLPALVHRAVRRGRSRTRPSTPSATGRPRTSGS